LEFYDGYLLVGKSWIRKRSPKYTPVFTRTILGLALLPEIFNVLYIFNPSTSNLFSFFFEEKEALPPFGYHDIPTVLKITIMG